MRRTIIKIFIMACAFIFPGMRQDANAQAITYKCYLRSGCTDTLSLLKDYHLFKGGEFVVSGLNGNGTAVLKDTGTYVLRSNVLAVTGDSITLHIRYGENADTIKQDDIYEVAYIDGKPPKGMPQGGGWLCCGEPCNGHKVDYFDNGKKMFEATFRKGRPVGKMIYYDEKGEVRYMRRYNRRGEIK